MRHYILLLLALCLHIAARGQTGWKYEYWFDNDRTIVKLDSSATDIWHIDADVSGLSNSLHTFHFQVVGNDTLPSSPVTRYFFKMADPLEASVRYWFDNDLSTAQEGETVGDIVLLDVSQIADGFHIVHIQVDGGPDAVSSPISKGFIKIPQTIGVDDFTCYCFIDGQLFKQEKVSASGGVIGWDFDVSELSHGLHRILVQVVTPSGAASNTWQSFFLRETTHAEFAEMKCLYAIDGAEFYTEAGVMSDGTYHFDLDVSALEDGLHRITYMLDNGNGVSTTSQTQFFMKTPLGGSGISEYWYWLNEMGDQQANKITLPERQNPFSLISLLPVESQPIRSKLFQFRVEQDQPVIYAKNEIHVRFFEASGRFIDFTKEYVDESVRQEVTEVDVLEPGVIVTFDKPSENTVRWYQLEARRGDSLAFKTDYPCTIQLFSPMGEELYSVAGSKAVSFGGAYAPEDGTYYLALHDVTSQSCSNISVDYWHIDKYAVLNVAPNDLGVLPCIQIVQVKGNGFDKMISASLIHGNQQILTDNIYPEGKSDAFLLFELQGDEELGNYDLILTFRDEDDVEELCLADAISLSDPDFADFDIQITDPRTVAVPYPVSVSITNSGNLTYSDIPFFMAYDNVEAIKDMCFLNFEVEADTSLVNEGLKFVYEVENFKGENEKAKMIPAIIPFLMPGETKSFKLGFSAGNHAHYNVYAWAGTPWSLNASETMSAIYTMAANAGGSGSEGGGSGSEGGGSGSEGGGSGSEGSGSGSEGGSSNVVIPLPGTGSGSSGAVNNGVMTSCVPDPCGIAGLIGKLQECLCGTTMGLANVIGGIQLSLQNRHNSAQREQLAASGLFDNPYEFFPSYRLPHPGDILRNWAGHCIPGKLGQVVNSMNRALDALGHDPCPEPKPHNCNQYNPGDPNDIFGYLAESGSRYMTDRTTDVYYTIEFENDPKLANASAHKIIVRDTLDTSRFDLSTFAAKSVKLGDVVMELKGEKNFSKKTMDLRPDINVIAQVSLSLDEEKGIAQWTIESLDPMTMEFTYDVMQGVLPVNYTGKGQGELAFDISLNSGLNEGESITNRAAIIFDQEGMIMTPSWKNTVDATAPESHVTDVRMQNDSTVTVSIDATDELSGPWRYNVYVQYGSGAWFLGAENVAADTTASVKVYEGIDHGFYVVAIDSAGNFESKEPVREFSFEVFASQVDTDTKLQLAQGWNWISHNQQEALSAETLKPNARRIVSQTDELYRDDRIGWTGTLTELQPTELYKVEMTGTDEVQLGGRLFNASFRNVPLYAGWNWIGYPVANAMSPSQALQKMDAEEGDFIVGQDGMTTYSNGQWTGTLTEMQPGQGYMYRSVSNKSLFLNATAQNRVRRHDTAASASNDGAPIPESWTVDKRKYPNVMGMVADLLIDEVPADAGDWLLAAFSGAECRGLSQPVDGHLMMNVYGTGGELITFLALNRASGEVVTVVESESFRSDILGTLQQSYELHNGMATGITELEEENSSIDNATVIDLLGRPVNTTAKTGEGVYIVTDGEKKQKRVTTQSPKP